MTTLLFWVATTVILYIYIGYPVWIYMQSRLHPRRWRQQEINASISIILAVHNGAKLLRAQVRHLLKLEYAAGPIQIVVVSDGSDDGTNEILAKATNPRVVPIVCPEHRGKANALNHGIRRATGDILVFVDIRPRLERTALTQLISNFADPEVGCVAGELCLRTDVHDGSTKAVSNLYWRYEQMIRKCEAMVDSPVGVYGGFYAVRRHLVTSLPEGLILDDMYQPLSIVRQGFRSVIDDRARVWDVWPKSSAAEFKRKVRTLAGNYQLVAKAKWLLGSTNRLRLQLISHKLLRLTVPFLLFLVFVTTYLLRTKQPYATVLVGQGIFYAVAALGILCDIPILRRVTGPASAFVLLNAAAVSALFMFTLRRDSLLALWVKPRPASEPGTVSAG